MSELELNAAIEAACLVLIEPEPGHTVCCGLPLPCEIHDCGEQQ